MDKIKKNHTYLRNKTEKNQNIVTITISVDGKWTFFPVKLELEGELSE